jgi:hypothetical protein
MPDAIKPQQETHHEADLQQRSLKTVLTSLG